jgi:hypothetical protein
MTLDEVAVVAATNPDSVVGQVANIEIQRRAADAQIRAADAQMRVASVHRITVWGTFALVGACVDIHIRIHNLLGHQLWALTRPLT